MAASRFDYDDPADRLAPLITPDLSIQWIEDGKVIFTVMNAPTQAVYDQWEGWLRETLARWPQEHRLGFLYDFRSRQFAVTLYMGTRLRDFSSMYTRLRTVRAIIYTHGPVSRALIAGIRLLRLPEGDKREFFTDYDSAVRWLRDQFAQDRAALVASADTPT